jgi:hypothetical protein
MHPILEPLVGGTIEEIGFDPVDESYCLIVRKDGRHFNVWFMDKNNEGPGHINVEEEV